MLPLVLRRPRHGGTHAPGRRLRRQLLALTVIDLDWERPWKEMGAEV